MSVSNIGATSVSMINIDGLDLESQLMAVQSNRVNLMDQGLKDQMSVVQARNSKIADLNTKLSGLNELLALVSDKATDPLTPTLPAATVTALKAVLPASSWEALGLNASTVDVKAGIVALTAAPCSGQNLAEAKAYLQTHKNTPQADVRAALTAMGFNSTVTDSIPPHAQSDFNINNTLNKAKDTMVKDTKCMALTDRADLEAYVKTIQGQVDGLGNSQQMDMLRMQSMSNKRNEAFEIMTTFMKKVADSNSGIVRNMG